MKEVAEYHDSMAVRAVRISRRRFLGWVGVGLAVLAIPRPLWAVADPKISYRETIAVLQMLYRGEVEAMLRYEACQAQALKEGHENIAHLFAAISASESVHAAHFSKLLVSMDVQVDSPEVVAATMDLKVGSTKENLRYATDVELSEIDVHYPQYLARIKGEKNKKAQKNITYAWEAERQHRALISEIQSGTGFFFGTLLRRFRSTDTRYFVCQNCGSTLTVMPTEKCPVCGFLLRWYQEIPRPTS
ncbi:MAG: rubrerythrin family protein [Mariprofundus sp.]